ncbi:GTPase activating protein, partial [Cladochytrium tenue]
MLLDHPLARPLQPYIPRALQPVLTSQTVSAPPPPQHEYEPARVYLARWAHELQVARSREEVGVLLGQRAAEAADAAAMAAGHLGSPPLATSMLSSSISLLSGSVVQAARALTASGRLRMLYEEEHVVWDETVQAETGIGTFEVLSTDTTPPPPKVERQAPLSSAEWRLFFDHHVPLPAAPSIPSSSSSSGGPRRTPSPGTPPAQLSASMVEVVRDEESFEEVAAAVEEPSLPRGCEGRIVVPLSDIRRRIFAGGVDTTARSEVWRFLFGLYDWDSTYAERKAIKAARTAEYWRMKHEWLATAERLGDVSTQDDVDPDDKPGLMYYDAVTRVDKDILRT